MKQNKYSSLSKINNFLGIAFLSGIIALVVLPVISSAATTIPLCEITRGLRVGSSGEDVRCLQRYLNWSGNTIATQGPGSPGSETAYFGSLTANAVRNWQNANSAQVLSPAGLTVGTGYFGPLSFNWYVSIVKTQLALGA